MFNKILGCGTVAATLAISSATTQAQNLLVDPNFAGPGTANPITVAGVNQGWALFNGASSASFAGNMPASIYSPYGSPAVTTSLLETANVGNNWNPAGAYQIVTGITPGQTYTFSIWGLTDTANDAYAGTAGLLIQLGFETSALGGASTVENPGGVVGISAALPSTQGIWTEYSVTATAPAGYTDAIVYNMFQDNGSTTITENMYYDLATLTPAPEPTTLALAGLGGMSLLSLIRRRKS